MITPQDLEPLAKSDFGKLLMEYLKQSISEMSELDKIKSFEEMVGKQEAIKVLKELFSFLESGREQKIEKTKTNYL